MKISKLFPLSLCFLMLCGCSSNKTIDNYSNEMIEGFSPTQIVNYQKDYDEYKKISSDTRSFKAVMPSDFLDYVHAGNDGVFILSSTYCGVCQKMMPILDELAKEKNLVFYNIEPEMLRSGSTTYYDFIAFMGDNLETDNGKKIIQSPHIFIVSDGKIIASKIGMPSKDENETKQEILDFLNQNIFVSGGSDEK